MKGPNRVPMLRPGQIYRHRKHTESAWHEYKIIAVVDPGEPGLENYWFRSDILFTNTELGNIHRLTVNREIFQALPAVDTQHVAYVNTRDPKKAWLRPLEMFLTPGRFILQ